MLRVVVQFLLIQDGQHKCFQAIRPHRQVPSSHRQSGVNHRHFWAWRSPEWLQTPRCLQGCRLRRATLACHASSAHVRSHASQASLFGGYVGECYGEYEDRVQHASAPDASRGSSHTPRLPCICCRASLAARGLSAGASPGASLPGGSMCDRRRASRTGRPVAPGARRVPPCHTGTAPALGNP